MKIRALLFAGAIIAATSLTASAQYSIRSSVIGAGGGPMSNGTYKLNGTVGQPVIGPVNNGVFTDNQGFWYTLSNAPSSVKPIDGDVAGFELGQNYPNPFNPSTAIRFSVPERVQVTLRVMNLLGEEVARIIDAETYDKGQFEVDFIAKDIPSGTYVYRLEAGNVVKTKKMVLMK